MKRKQIYLIGGLTIVGLLLSKMSRAAYYTITDWLIPQFEGFRATPYWDQKQWTWGYGTRAPGETGVISREKALSDMRAYINADYAYLSGLITRPLSPAQWAALLSFSYNEGRGNADNLVENINSGNDAALGVQWKKYIYAGGAVSQDLIDRRETEFNIWQGNV